MLKIIAKINFSPGIRIFLWLFIFTNFCQIFSQAQQVTDTTGSGTLKKTFVPGRYDFGADLQNHQKNNNKQIVDTAKIIDETNILIKTNIEKLTFLNPDLSNSFDITNYDKIVTFEKELYIVKIQNITPSEIIFRYPLNTFISKIHRTKVSQILYANGKIDLFKPIEIINDTDTLLPDERIIVKEIKDWKKVIVVYSETDVPYDLVEKGIISARYESSKIKATGEFLEKNGMIIIRKKAANIEADYLLITNKNIHKAYGDLPFIELEGIAYGNN
ncbi:MAG: hypothetical protein JXJ22_10810 [Bacteroidales bacterium]|nr:hypothetical protein [Bacteroidales bacterium]